MPTKVKPNAVILHSQQYGAIPYADSEGLIKNSGLPRETLAAIGVDHRLGGPELAEAMLTACKRIKNF